MATGTSLWADDYSGVPMTMTPIDVSSASTFQISDRTIVIFHNSSTNTTYTCTITAQPNRHNRAKNITQTLTGTQLGVALLPSEGWATLGGQMSVLGSNAAVLAMAVNMRD
jgi:hypothetical protein